MELVSQTKCSDVVGQSLVAAPSDVSGSRCSVLLDQAPPCKAAKPIKRCRFHRGGWGSGEGMLTPCAPSNAKALGKAHLFIYFFLSFLFFFLPLWFSVDRSVLRHALIYSSAVFMFVTQPDPSAPLDFFNIPSLSPSFHFSSIFSTRDCAVPSASNICSSGFLLLLTLLPLPFFPPPALKCFSSACLASNPPQSLLSSIHENADPQQGREKRQQT